MLQYVFMLSNLFLFFYRGISSTVRRCIEKETGREFAAKIIDVGAESGDASPSQMLEATRQEIAILRQVMGHPYISTFKSFTIIAIMLNEFTLINSMNVTTSFFSKCSWTTRCVRIRCLYLPRVWTVPKWWTVRLLNVGSYTFGKEDKIYYEVKIENLINSAGFDSLMNWMQLNAFFFE